MLEEAPLKEESVSMPWYFLSELSYKAHVLSLATYEKLSWSKCSKENIHVKTWKEKDETTLIKGQ